MRAPVLLRFKVLLTLLDSQMHGEASGRDSRSSCSRSMEHCLAQYISHILVHDLNPQQQVDDLSYHVPRFVAVNSRNLTDCLDITSRFAKLSSKCNLESAKPED